MITQKLGDRSYSLRPPPTKPWTKQLTTTVFSILTIPIMIPTGVLMTVVMATPLRDMIQSILVPFVMDTVAQEFHAERMTLLEHVQGRVLDVGSGGGAYLDYCQNAQEVVAVEPNSDLHPIIQKRGNALNLPCLKIVPSLEDVLKQEQPESFDWVILGNVLCEVPCVPSTLRTVDQLLKPGTGHVYFSEHIGQPRGTWQRSVQNFINPMWRHVGGGCNCNRDSLMEIQKQPNWKVIVWKYPHISVAFGPFVLGLAQKC